MKNMSNVSNKISNYTIKLSIRIFFLILAISLLTISYSWFDNQIKSLQNVYGQIEKPPYGFYYYT